MGESIDRAVEGLLERRLWRVAMFALLVLLAASAFGERGVAVGVVAVAVFVVGGGVFLLWPAVVGSWCERHPALDRLVVAPVGFLACATLSPLSAGVCVLVGLALWGVCALCARPGAVALD